MNTPNKITLSRILLIPIIVFFYLAEFVPYGKLIAALIFTIACATDFVDGMIARKTGQVTDLGKFFDAIADKVLIMAGMILVIAFPVASGAAIVKPLWLGIVFIVLMLAREFIISALRQIAAAKGFVLAAEKSGKIKATLQDIAIALYMFYAFYVAEFFQLDSGLHKTLNTVFGLLTITLLGIATALTIYSGCSYIYKNRKVFSENKVAKVVAELEVEETTLAATENEQKIEDVAKVETLAAEEIVEPIEEVKTKQKYALTDVSRRNIVMRKGNKKLRNRR